MLVCPEDCSLFCAARSRDSLSYFRCRSAQAWQRLSSGMEGAPHSTQMPRSLAFSLLCCMLRRFSVNANLILSIFASLKLTHLPLIAQRFYQWSGLQELFPASREGAVGMGTSHHHPKFPFYRVLLGSHFSPPILHSSCAWVLM